MSCCSTVVLKRAHLIQENIFFCWGVGGSFSFSLYIYIYFCLGGGGASAHNHPTDSAATLNRKVFWRVLPNSKKQSMCTTWQINTKVIY